VRGVVFTGNSGLEFRDFDDPRAGPGQAVIKIQASGMCGSDLHHYHAVKPRGNFISGHEPCGIIEELGPGSPRGVKVGDRVMVHHYEGCGVCEPCALGYEHLCPQEGGVTYGGGTGHGSNAPYMLVPSRTLVHLPEELSFEEGAAVSCGSGTAWVGLKKMDISGRDTVAIFGQGPVGLSGTMYAKAMGARVIAIDVIPERLKLAQAVGADHVINANDADPVQAIRDLTHGGATASLESSGNPRARSQCLECLRTFGRAAYIGMGAPSTATIDVQSIVLKCISIYGSWTFSKAELSEVSRHMVDAGVDLSKIITHRYSLDQADEAIKTFEAGKTGKCVFVFD
jgi:threonine dehydrogenase-like Zn-dependent dehydrogenase